MYPNYIYVETIPLGGQENMAIDIFLLDFAIKHNIKAILRLYSWCNTTISVGRNQNQSIISDTMVEKYNLEIVKRPSGGRAVLHLGDISYSYITRIDSMLNGCSVIESYKNISSAMILGLAGLGISGLSISDSKDLYTKSNACMATTTGSDVEYNGYKIVGSAQLRKSEFLLQHGSIQVQDNKNLLCAILELDITTLKYISVEEIINKIPTKKEIYTALKDGFESHFSTKYLSMPIEELGYKCL